MTVAYARLNQALEGCKKTLSLSGDWYSACVRVSNILISMGRFEEASQWHSMAIETTPNPVQFHAKAAFIYIIQEKWDEAIRGYKQLLKIDPQYIDAHRQLAQIYSRLGKLEDELTHCYAFLTHKPEMGSPDGHYKLGQSLQEHGKLEWAASCYQRVISLNNKYWPAYYGLAELRLQQQQWEAAAECYQKLLEQDPTQVEAHHKLGTIWLQQKHYNRAIAKFKAMNQLVPEFAAAYLGLIQCLMELEHWDAVIATCRSTISFVGEFPWTYRHMGRAFTQKGEEMKAIACYQKVGQLNDWAECQQNDYEFTEDHFSHHIPIWREHLKPLIEAKGVAALTLGSHQGMTICWLLDTVLNQASDELFCIDQAFSRLFDRNINQTSGLDKIVCMEGKPLALMGDLPSNAFDLIVLQDRRKQVDHIQQEIRQCWPLLRNEGVMIVKDYGWHHPSGPQQSPKAGVDRFLKTVQGEFKILVQDDQLILKKQLSS